jgi:hypothetical protein
MAGQKTIGVTYVPPLPPPPASYHAVGITTPPTAGNYFIAGTYNSQIYYYNPTTHTYLYYYPTTNNWFVSLTLPKTEDLMWISNSSVIVDGYDPGGDVDGEISMLAGPA